MLRFQRSRCLCFAFPCKARAIHTAVFTQGPQTRSSYATRCWCGWPACCARPATTRFWPRRVCRMPPSWPWHEPRDGCCSPAIAAWARSGLASRPLRSRRTPPGAGCGAFAGLPRRLAPRAPDPMPVGQRPLAARHLGRDQTNPGLLSRPGRPVHGLSRLRAALLARQPRPADHGQAQGLGRPKVNRPIRAASSRDVIATRWCRCSAFARTPWQDATRRASPVLPGQGGRETLSGAGEALPPYTRHFGRCYPYCYPEDQNGPRGQAAIGLSN